MIATIQNVLQQALAKLDTAIDKPIQVDRTKRAEHGHFSTNLPLVLTKILRQPPMKIAELLIENMDIPEDSIEKVEVKAPGFINFFLTPASLQVVVADIHEKGENYGRSQIGQNRKVQVEFVSANPTGPLTVGHGRQAVLGDTVARVLEWTSYDVDREYYYNDAGRQMRILGYSTYYRYRQALGFGDEFPEDHYQGDYIVEIGKQLAEKHGDKYKDDKENDIFKKSAESAVFEDINSTLKDLGIVFDRYYNEQSLYDDGKIDEVLKKLAEKKATYEKDGAIWFKASEYGAADDRVLWKSIANEATYRLPDIAYHTTKYARGYDLMIDVFGADHHATYPDVLAGLNALDYDTSKVNVLIHQFVTLTRGGEKIKMSTRKATYVTLDELAKEVGKDVVRYFFLMRGAKSHLNFDLELAKTESDENPVFYLQYAHARICSILRNAVHKKVSADNPDHSLLREPETLDLINYLSEFQETGELCARTLEPQHMTTYLQKMATAFHKFYSVHRVLSDDEQLSKARLSLVKAVKTVMYNGLTLIGITAPERM